jgi:hypothetical protein
VSIALHQRIKELEAQVSQLVSTVADHAQRLAKLEQARKPGPKPKDK